MTDSMTRRFAASHKCSRVIYGVVAVLFLSIDVASQLYAQDAPVSYRLDSARSQIFVTTHRTGLFSFLGHDHAILAREWSGTICYSPAAPLQGHGTIDVATASLVIDTDSARAIARLGGGPSSNQVRELQAKFLDAQHLDAAHHPSILLNVRKVTAAQPNKLQVQGQLTIRDRTRELDFPIALVNEKDTVRFHGVVSVPQSSFGIKPESVAGVVKVADVVDIHFDLVGVSTDRTCAAN